MVCCCCFVREVKSFQKEEESKIWRRVLSSWDVLGEDREMGWRSSAIAVAAAAAPWGLWEVMRLRFARVRC